MTEEEIKTDSPEIKQETTTEEPTTQEPQENSEDINWKKFREQRKLEKQRMAEAEKKATEAEMQAEAIRKAMESLLENEEKPTQKNEESEEEKYKKYVDEAFKKREQQLQQERIENEKKELPKKIRSTCPDFDQVCTEENLNYLEYHQPALAKGLSHIPDEFEKWSSVYQAIKKFAPQASENNSARVDKNLSKPQSISVPQHSSSGDSKPYALDEARKRDNWRRMQQHMKGLG